MNLNVVSNILIRIQSYLVRRFIQICMFGIRYMTFYYIYLDHCTLPRRSVYDLSFHSFVIF